MEGNLVISNTIPTLDTHATSKLYVDSRVNLKYNILNDGDLSISKILDLQIILDGKQDVTTTSSSSPSISSNPFIGFRAVTSQNTDLTIGINAVIPFNSVSVNIFTYDTQSRFNTTTSTYTIPTGYSRFWNFNVSLFIA